MAHQVELEKTKYRNWVRGGMAYKYLKQGIEGFADDLVLQEHKRILQNIKHTPGQPCARCSIGSLKPKHASACPRGQINCSCLDRKKKPCPNQVCDAIMGDILDSHCSQPPAPYWKNADIQKWCSDPWEVAKCFINSPGYADKTSAAAIDASGLLHVFINNTKLHSHLSCAIFTNGTDVFSKVRRRRNQIFHSPTMEMDHNDLNDCIADIITLLGDAKELKQRPEAKAAVEKLTQLKQNSFVITTNNEVEVCRDAMVSIASRSEELKQMIETAKNDLDNKVTEAIGDKTQNALEEALGRLKNQNESQFQAMKHAVELLNERMKHVETDNAAFRQDISFIKQQLCNLEELDTARHKHSKQLEYVEKKQAFQRSLVERYEKGGYFNTSISPLKTQQNNIAVNEIYVTPNMEIEKKADECSSTGPFSGPDTTKGWSEYHVSHGSKTPAHVESELKRVDGYRDIFQTGRARYEKVYIIGDVGTGKSTLSKMMIFNWCRAIRDENKETENTDSKCDNEGQHNGNREQDCPTDSDKTSNTSPSWVDEQISAVNKREISKFDFLFTIPLQRMSGFRNIMDMLKDLYNANQDVETGELMTEIFKQESERCLILADGLDEWTPPKDASSPQHVSSGIPVRDGVKNATLVTLSRPSAKGILKMKLTEYDQKIKLLGVHTTSVDDFVSKYMGLNGKKDKKDEHDFMMKIRETNLEHLEKTPLILQQLVWLYCIHDDIGKSVADIYSNIVNIIFGWFENKEDDITQPSVNTEREYEQMQLPELLKRFPRCEQNESILLSLVKLAFKSSIEDGISNFGRYGCGLSKDEIDTLIRCGILVEHNCYDPTIQKSSLSFIHISYLEFFAAVYISGHYCEQCPTSKTKPTLQRITVLNELFMNKKSAEDILQLSNILRMVCGLSPFLIEEISSLISKQMMSDQSMSRYRKEFSQFYRSVDNNDVCEIQNLICDCLLQCRADDKPAVSLCDVIIIEEPDKEMLTNIIPESVVSADIQCYNWTTATTVEIMELVATFHWVQFIGLKDINSCEACKHLSSFISHAVLSRQLLLVNIRCDQNVCEGHAFDLSKHDKLESIHIDECSFVLQSVVNSKSLESINISMSCVSKTPHAICENLSYSITQAVSLKQLTLENIGCDRDDCEGHAIDLSRHDQLKSIQIDDGTCMLGSVVNTNSLKSISILGSYSQNIQHVILKNVSSSLTQAVSLTQLTLRNISCDRDDCESHAFDFSQIDQLKSIQIDNCSCLLGSVVNTKSLESISISEGYIKNIQHGILEHLSASLTQAVSLKQLILRDLYCDRDDCEGHAIDLSKHNQLESIQIDDCTCMLGSVVNTESLKRLFIAGSSLQKTQHGILEHLSASLTQAVSLTSLTLEELCCDRDDCDGHVFDLSKHNQLKKLEIDDSPSILGSVVHTNSLEIISISESCESRKTPHGICEHLSSSLTQSVSFKELYLKNIHCNRDDCEGHGFDLSKHDQLKSIQIENCPCMLGFVVNTNCLETISIVGSITPHGICEKLSSLLTQAVSFKELILENIRCDRDDCEGHALDLSKHDQLESIQISHCQCLLGFVLNSKSLQSISISEKCGHKTPHWICENLSSSLTQAVSLTELDLQNINCDRDDCEGHAFDLTKHNQLKSIHIDDGTCMLGSVVNTETLQSISISESYGRKIPHEICENLSSSLTQAVSLTELILENINCDRDDCEGHAFDLSKHSQLEIIQIEDCSHRLGSIVNGISLQWISISEKYGRKTPHGICDYLSSSLTQAVYLTDLILKHINCDRADCEGHAFDLSKHNQLESIQIDDCTYQLGSVVNTCSLDSISISGSYGRKTPHGICDYLSSSLTQAMCLKELILKHIHCDRADCEGHAFNLSKHNQLESIQIDDCTYQLGSVVNTKSLDSISISGSYGRKTPHWICENLSSSITQSLSLTRLILKNINCDRDGCKSHAFDLSKHDQLESIKIDNCSHRLESVVNTES